MKIIKYINQVSLYYFSLFVFSSGEQNDENTLDPLVTVKKCSKCIFGQDIFVFTEAFVIWEMVRINMHATVMEKGT